MLLPVEAVVSGEPGRTLTRDDEHQRLHAALTSVAALATG
jgi:hypothetical protein